MPYIVDHDGSATEITWEAADEHPGPWYSTLVGPAQTHGVQVSAFDKAMTAVEVYDTAEALKIYPKLPAPSGVRADYRVCFMDGKFYPKGIHPSDAMAIGLARDMKDDPDRMMTAAHECDEPMMP